MLEWCPHCQAFKRTERRRSRSQDLQTLEFIFITEITCYACNNTIRTETERARMEGPSKLT